MDDGGNGGARAGGALGLESPTPTPDVRTHVSSALPPPGVSLETDEAPAVSPDGSRLLFVGHDANGKQLLYTLALDVASPAKPLANTDGASLPFWSPDSHSVGFFGQGKLKTVDIETGQIRTLADAGAARGGTWNRDDIILFAPRPAPVCIAFPRPAASPRQWRSRLEECWFPSFLPDGRHFLFFTPVPSEPENAGVFVASLDSSTAKRLVTAQSRAVHAPRISPLLAGRGAAGASLRRNNSGSARESCIGRERGGTQSVDEPRAVFGIGLRHARVLRGRRR